MLLLNIFLPFSYFAFNCIYPNTHAWLLHYTLITSVWKWVLFVYFRNSDAAFSPSLLLLLGSLYSSPRQSPNYGFAHYVLHSSLEMPNENLIWRPKHSLSLMGSCLSSILAAAIICLVNSLREQAGEGQRRGKK